MRRIYAILTIGANIIDFGRCNSMNEQMIMHSHQCTIFIRKQSIRKRIIIGNTQKEFRFKWKKQ